MTRPRYHEAAEEELLHEIGYLEFQAQGLGRRFFAEIRRAEDTASRNFLNRLRKSVPASGSAFSGPFSIHSYMQSNEMAY